MCESTLPLMGGNGAIAWCDGSPELAWEMQMHRGIWQPISIPPHLVGEWQDTGHLRKIDALPRDHWHAHVERDETA